MSDGVTKLRIWEWILNIIIESMYHPTRSMAAIDSAEKCIKEDSSDCDLDNLYMSAFRYYRLSCNVKGKYFSIT